MRWGKERNLDLRGVFFTPSSLRDKNLSSLLRGEELFFLLQEFDFLLFLFDGEPKSMI